jgi:hypothetical protein
LEIRTFSTVTLDFSTPGAVKMTPKRLFYSRVTLETTASLARINMILYGLNGTSLRYAQALKNVRPEVLREAYRISDDPARARASIIQSDQPATPEQVMEHVTLFDWSDDPAEADQGASDAGDQKSCSVCGVSPREKPGTWYVIDDRIYCGECAASHSGQMAGECVEVTYG